MKQRTALFFVVSVVIALGQPSWRMKQVADVASGLTGIGNMPLGDTDSDSAPELHFWRATQGERVWRWETWEYRTTNRYELVKAETCMGIPEPPPGMSKGTFVPCDIGDVDDDGLRELLGVNDSVFYTGSQIDSVRHYVCLYECPSPFDYPDTLLWSYWYFTNGCWSPHVWYSGDLDRDGRKDIVFSAASRTYVFENRGDNLNDLVWLSPLWRAGYDYAFGDFDQDSAREFVYSDINWNGHVFVFECNGDDSYVLVDSVQHYWPNGHDVWSGNDLDQDGRPEFFVKHQRINPYSCFYVYMFEATGDNEYESTLVDSIVGGGVSDAENSVCSDIDQDGVEELLVSFNYGINVYKATGNNQFRRVWQWVRPRETHIQTFDMNHNGYPDIVLSGDAHTWVFEMEAIKLLTPNGGDSLTPGETCQVRWRTYTPPRCDSVSLFLRTDSTWLLDTIATGLSPADSTFDWVVPPGPIDSCRVVAIAYGPGWQFDESDSAFAIVPAGIEELPRVLVRDWTLSVSPNPAGARAMVGYDVPVASEVSLVLFDAAGRVVSELASGPHQPGSYSVPLCAKLRAWSGTGTHFLGESGIPVPTQTEWQPPAGVYFVRLEAAGFRLVKKLTLVTND